MRTVEFNTAYDYTVPEEHFEKLINYLEEQFPNEYNVFYNQGYNLYGIYSYISGNIEWFEYYKNTLYHLNKYLIQRDLDHKECNSITRYPRISRINPHKDGRPRENSEHIITAFSLLDWKRISRSWSYLTNVLRLEVDHIDHNRYNNDPDNLELVTKDYNKERYYNKTEKTDYKANEIYWLGKEDDYHYLIEEAILYNIFKENDYEKEL